MIDDAVGVIGLLLAYADHHEIDVAQYQTVGWLLTGLGALRRDLANITGYFNDALTAGRHLDAGRGRS